MDKQNNSVALIYHEYSTCRSWDTKQCVTLIHIDGFFSYFLLTCFAFIYFFHWIYVSIVTSSIALCRDSYKITMPIRYSIRAIGISAYKKQYKSKLMMYNILDDLYWTSYTYRDELFSGKAYYICNVLTRNSCPLSVMICNRSLRVSRTDWPNCFKKSL